MAPVTPEAGPLDAEIRRLEAELVEARKLEVLGRLAGQLTHDFNNLLTTIIGHATFLRARLPEDDPRRPDLEAILDAAHRGTDLTRKVLALRDQQSSVMELLDLGLIVADLDETVRRLAGDAIERRVVAGPGLWSILADRAQMTQLVLTVVIRVIDDLSDGDRLTLETRNATGEGSGLPPGAWVMLIVRGTRGRRLDTDPLAPGSPLVPARDLARSSGGDLHVTGDPDGIRVTVHLPRAE